MILLQQKKYRKESGLFLVEGEKSVLELLNSDLVIKYVFFNNDIFNELAANVKPLFEKASLFLCNAEEIASISSQKNNHTAVACVEIPPIKFNEKPLQKGEYIFVLDSLQDPGNLGTIIRIADWFSINRIVCSDDTVDFYNPKTISATKGSFTRIQPFFTNIETFLSEFDDGRIFGTDMNGTPTQKIDFQNEKGIIIFGNEANGISENLKKYVQKTICIEKKGKAESLNVAVSASIIAYCITNIN